jgi:catechol 2,3-dioxygenase-like lactoylglutathione lyase family enzyme
VKFKVFRPAALLLMVFLGATVSQLVRPEVKAQSSDQAPALIYTCLITNDVKQLTEFYEGVLQIKPRASGDRYVEFPTQTGTLAIFGADAQEKYIPGSAQAGQNRSAILEFKVANVDAEYSRLQGIVKVWVKPPTTQPWGSRSIYFRDPDGNLVDFFTRVKPLLRSRSAVNGLRDEARQGRLRVRIKLKNLVQSRQLKQFQHARLRTADCQHSRFP